MFAEELFLISTDDKDVLRSNLDSVISGIIESAVQEYETDTDMAKEKLRKSFRTALGLLKG